MELDQVRPELRPHDDRRRGCRPPGAAAEATPAPLVVIQAGDLETALAAVAAAGGAITRPIFSFPGGKRFHFRDPNGNELAAYQVSQA